MDLAAFTRLFEDHHAPLFRFAYRLTGSLADAEDVVQECFLTLLRPNAYDPDRTPIRTYLFGMLLSYSTTAMQIPLGPEEKPRRAVAWLAPDLGCFALKITVEQREDDGSFQLMWVKSAITITVN